MIIAIDGPAASGKGTLAKLIAAHYGYAHLDTGMLYRGVGRDMVRGGHDFDDAAAAASVAHALDPATLGDPSLRGRDMSEAASRVAVIPEVREALLQIQKNFAAAQTAGSVIEGRDIGTVIFPHADVKLFITADLRERARRRHRELMAAGENVTEEVVFADLEQRDRRDQTRAASPLHMAADAHLLDTTKLDIESAFFAAVRLIDAAMGRSATT